MKNKEREKLSPLQRLLRYLATLVGATLAFYGAGFVVSTSKDLLTHTVVYVISLFLAFTAFILAGMLRKTEHMIASKAVYCATVLFNGVSSGVLVALVCVWCSAVPTLTEFAVCAGGVVVVLALTAALTAFIRRRGAIYAVSLLSLVALVWVIRQLVVMGFGNSFYIISAFSLVFIAFRLILCFFILSEKNYFRHDALLSFGVAIAVGVVALVIFSDGALAQTMIEVGGIEKKGKK